MIKKTRYESFLLCAGLRLSTTLLTILMIATAQSGQAEDFDQDGIDDANDLCLSTDLNGPIPTGILCDGCMGDDQTILGCNASDVLACKPGPNNHQFEMGINQRIQDTFSAQKGWAAKCGCDDNSDTDGDGFLNCVDQCPSDGEKSLAGLCGCGISETDSDGDGTPDCLDLCPNNPGATVPDEYGNCASETQTISAGEALVLALDGAALSIPADALEAGMTVTLAEIDPNFLDEPPNAPGEMQITPVYSLSFSAAQPVIGDLTLALDIPPSVTTGFFARIKIEGGLGTEDQSDSDWLIIPGEYDTQQSQLTIVIGATATRFLVTGISPDAAAPSNAAGVLTNEAKDPVPMVTQSLAATAVESLFSTPDWASHGWVVFCSPPLFSSFSLTSCDPSSPEFEPMMNDLGSKLYASDQILTTLGFPKGEMSRISADSIERMWTIPHVIYDPDNRSITTASTTAAGLSYFPAWVDPDVTDNRLGVYRPAFGVIYIDRLASDEVAIHELMHAVQYGQINNAWDHGWVREGLASAVQVFAPSNTAPSGGEFRYYGNWRDWQFPLSSNDNINEYKVSEFWLTLDGTLSLLPTFYSNLGASLLTEYNAYLEVDDALINTGLPSIRDGYTSLIQSRNSDPGYEYCALPLGLICSDTSCDILTDTAPFSAQCFDIYNIENDLCPEEETPDIKVTLVSDSEQFPFANMKLMVDGIIHDANTEVPFSEGHIWSINTTYTDGNSPTEVTLKFECQTDYMKLVKQRINSDATAVATTSFFNTLSPSRETSFQTYNSFEDLSADSFITTYKWSDGVIIDEDVIVEPLNLDVWGASNSVSAFAQLQEDGDASTASASSSVSTDTESDATSMTTTGQQSATASISGAPIYARASNSNEYTYAIGPVPVELTLSWACSMSNVQVYIINPVGGGSETLLLTSNNVNPLFNNWECGTRVWTIPPDNNVEIRIFTTFDEYPEAGESNEIYQNSGGLFEIILQAILPEN